MKIIISLIVAIVLAAAVAAYMGRTHVAAQGSKPLSSSSEIDVSIPPTEQSSFPASTGSESPRDGKVAPATGGDAAKTAGHQLNSAAQSIVLDQVLDTICSPRSTFAQRQAGWSQLRNSGKLDDAIAEFERRAAANPAVADYPAALGQACLHKASTIQDIREQGILGMRADQNFDAALNLDPGNWDARFWKATAMSYWPSQLGKGKEVIENFLELMRRQELVPPQPEFAQTYVLLGSEYLKQGQEEYAAQVWKRGFGLFPEHSELREKASQSEQ